MIATRKGLAGIEKVIETTASEPSPTDRPISAKTPRCRGRRRAEMVKTIHGPSSPKPPKLTPGVRLVRVHKGVRHVVTVLEKGFEWRGKTYRSLSSVAGAITGSHLSGVAFFGLKFSKKAKKS
jgi:Protein of unknown function (DUF2924)